MSVRWYYQLLFEEFGPVPVEQILKMRDEGTLQDGDLVRSEAGGDWISIATMKCLCQAPNPAESPAADVISDLSELNFVFESTRPTAPREVTADHSAQPQHMVASVAGNQSSQSPGLVPGVSTAPSSSQWYCKALGKTMGPMSLQELRGLAESGAFSADALVCCGESGAWQVAGSSPHISNALARGRAQSLDSSTTSGTSQRTGNTHAEEPTSREMPIRHQEKPVVATAKRKRRSPSNDDSKAVRSKNISSSGTGRRDGGIADEVFDEVFQKQDIPARQSMAATASMAAAMTSTEQFSRQETPPSITSGPSSSAMVSPSMSYSHGSNSVPASLSAAQFAAAAAKASKPTPRSKKSVSISEPMEPKKIATISATVLAVVAVLGIWKFGLPFGGGAAETPLDPKATVAVLQMILKNFDDLSRTTDQTAFEECMANVKPQMAAILAKTQDPKNNTPEAAACQAATKALMKIADSLPDKQEDIEQGVTEFQKQIALVQ